MVRRDFQLAALTAVIAAAIAMGPALDAGQAGTQTVQYRSPEGVEYRSLPDTDAVKSARAALDANPKDIARIIDLGVAQSGARQFREAIATFTRGLEIEPRSEEHTSELQSPDTISYAVFCLKKKKTNTTIQQYMLYTIKKKKIKT